MFSLYTSFRISSRVQKKTLKARVYIANTNKFKPTTDSHFVVSMYRVASVVGLNYCGCLQHLLAKHKEDWQDKRAVYKTALLASSLCIYCSLNNYMAIFYSVHSTKNFMNIHVNHVIVWCMRLIKIKSNWIMFNTSLDLSMDDHPVIF